MQATAQRSPDRAVLLTRQDSLCDIARRSNALHCPSESSWTTNGNTSAVTRREALQCPSRPASREALAKNFHNAAAEQNTQRACANRSRRRLQGVIHCSATGRDEKRKDTSS